MSELWVISVMNCRWASRPGKMRRSSDVFFFFQGEDGMRDLTVTGVQTCALPISEGKAREREGSSGAAGPQDHDRGRDAADRHEPPQRKISPAVHECRPDDLFRRVQPAEIGRASCRERGKISVVAVSLKKKRRISG